MQKVVWSVFGIVIVLLVFSIGFYGNKILSGDLITGNVVAGDVDLSELQTYHVELENGNSVIELSVEKPDKICSMIHGVFDAGIVPARKSQVFSCFQQRYLRKLFADNTHGIIC